MKKKGLLVPGMISQREVLKENLIDAIILIVMSALIWIFAWRKTDYPVAWNFLILLYAAYVVCICVR